ncbi:hypothetical protein L842_0654 [Mycobacterium intracellulare MIN_052511_1280]|nr:hypothetical protein L842_0654 [Mycobacterium intracellulare MIN_052511_1280]
MCARRGLRLVSRPAGHVDIMAVRARGVPARVDCALHARAASGAHRRHTGVHCALLARAASGAHRRHARVHCALLARAASGAHRRHAGGPLRAPCSRRFRRSPSPRGGSIARSLLAPLPALTVATLGSPECPPSSRNPSSRR